MAAETVELGTIYLVDLGEARSELGWAEALAQRGERDRAREHSSGALELSREHGYGACEPRWRDRDVPHGD